MTAHDPALQRPDPAPPAHFAAARPLLRPLATLTAITVAAAAGVFAWFGPLRPARFAGLPSTGLNSPGLAGTVSGSLLLAALGLAACLIITRARQRAAPPGDGLPASVSQRPRARWPDIVLTLGFTVAAAVVVLLDWPVPLRVPAHAAMMAQAGMAQAGMAQAGMVQAGLSATTGFAVASAALLLAAPWLLAERYFAAVPALSLPEVEDLRRLLFLPVFFLGAEALLQLAAALGFGPLLWARIGLAALLLALCAELALRVLATCFLPPPDSVRARAPIASVLAGIVRGRALSPASVAETVRTQFGMDFSRSWALHFMRAAFLPVVLLMLVFCWFLTGVTRVDLNQRGSYERFGVPVAMLQPGLHLLLPWPFGVVRLVDLGVIHAVPVSYTSHGAVPAVVPEQATAEGSAPVAANRLWDSDLPSDVAYIIASDDRDHQSFQTVTASVRVLFRVGLSDEAARAALYGEADPAALVHALAGRMLVQLFASQTLPHLLSGSQAVLAAEMRRRLQRGLGGLNSGIEIVSVVIEAIHPPAGAAAAYRLVQAAQIEAATEIAAERGRAKTTEGVARLNARNAIDDATALAATTVSKAQVDFTDITADDGPYRAAPRPFLLERYFHDVQSALHGVPLEIVDHRLSGTSLPTIDLRPPGAADLPATSPDPTSSDPTSPDLTSPDRGAGRP